MLDVTVTEVRNAIRCPRIFALGRMGFGRAAFPVGSSTLGATFHRVLAEAAKLSGKPSQGLQGLSADAAPAAIEEELSHWLLDLLADAVEAQPAHQSMPNEVDDVAEALRRFASYVVGHLDAADRPRARIKRFFQAFELPVEASFAGVRIGGRIDALHLRDGHALEVAEYKLTGAGEAGVDAVQAALYRRLLQVSRNVDAEAVVLRFDPELHETRLTGDEANAMVQGRVLPLLGSMDEWSERPTTAPATERRSMCPVCPFRQPCAQTYADHVPERDKAPAGRPGPVATPDGRVVDALAEPMVQPSADEDTHGREEAAANKQRLQRILDDLHVPATVEEPVLGARLIHFVLKVRGKGLKYVKQNRDAIDHELRQRNGRFLVAPGSFVAEFRREKSRAVDLTPLLAREETWLRERSGRFLLGETVEGQPIRAELGEPTTCHFLIGGQTGSGKSVLLQSIARGLTRLHGPDAIRLSLIDPKRLTFVDTSGFDAHLARPVCFDLEPAVEILEGLAGEMERRYRVLESRKFQDLDSMNAEVPPPDRLAREVVIIDEFQDLILQDKDLKERFLTVVQRLGAKARASGIHLLCATQYPKKEVVPGIIKVNLVARVALRVQDAVASKVIFGRGGAEDLLGKGDFLADLGSDPVRGQAPLP